MPSWPPGGLVVTWTPPPGYWSRKAEEWAEARDTADWRTQEALDRVRRRLQAKECDLEATRREAADLAAELQAAQLRLEGKVPDV